MKLIEGQILCIFSQVLCRHAEVVSGAYKLRTTQRGCGKNDDGTIAWRPLTETELLTDSMSVMQRQIEALYEHVEALGAEKADR